jgi:hypothetical protein
VKVEWRLDNSRVEIRGGSAFGDSVVIAEVRLQRSILGYDDFD